MSFFYPEYRFNPASFYDAPNDYYEPTPNETRYRRLAEEHERRALAALALAEEEERRRRQAAPRRYNLEDSIFSQPPSYTHQPNHRPYSYEQQLRDDHERQIEQWLERRRSREREEEEQRRRRDLERQREEDVIRQLLRGFGIESRGAATSPRRQARTLEDSRTEQQVTRPTCSCQHHQPQEAERERTRVASQAPRSPRVVPSAPAPTPTPAATADLGSRLWAALSNGRSDDEKAQILSELGLTPPPRLAPTTTPTIPIIFTTATPTTPTPRSTSPTVKSVPVTTQSTTKSTVPTPKPVTSTPKPAPTPTTPTRISPFAHIESIQVKFDASRTTFSTSGDVSVYQTELNKLLAMLDEVESSGAESVRGARKALVRAVEGELEELERGKVPEEKTEDAPVEEQEVKEESAAVPAEEEFLEAVAEPEVEAAPASEEHVDIKTAEADHLPEPEPEQAATEQVISETAPATSVHFVDSVSIAEPSSPALQPIVTEPRSETNTDAAAESRPSTPGATEDRGRSSAKSPLDKAKRPRSVEIEEVPDEGDHPSPKSAGFELL